MRDIFAAYHFAVTQMRIKPAPLPLLDMIRDTANLEPLPLLTPGNLKLMGAAMTALQSGASLPGIFRNE